MKERADIREADIQEIVQRVVRQVLGISQGAGTHIQFPSPGLDGAAKGSGKDPGQVVAIGADHGGFELKEILKVELRRLGFQTVDIGTEGREAVDYPDFAHEVAKMVGSGEAWRGVIVDGAGIGSCIVANKVPGVRAGMAYDYSSALNGREHNDTNVLALGAGLIGVNLAKQILRVWLSTEFAGGRHARRVQKIVDIEKQYLKKGEAHDS